MELADSSCFLGLPPAERWQQIYLALGGESECFLELPFLDQLRLILDQIGSEECIYSPEDFWRAWAAHVGVSCVEDERDAQKQIYAYYYDEAGDESLTDPSCFLGLPPDIQQQALFSGVLTGATPTDPPVNLTPPAITGTPEPGQILTVSTGVWSGGGITYSYQWNLNGANVGSDQNTYTVPEDSEDGDEIYCVVTATNSIGSAPADSNTVEVENEFDPSTVMDLVFEADYGVLRAKAGVGEPYVAGVSGTTITLYGGGNDIEPGDWVFAYASGNKRAVQVVSRESDTQITIEEALLGGSEETAILICEECDTDEDAVVAWVAKNAQGRCVYQITFSYRPLWYSAGEEGEPFPEVAYDGIDDDFITYFQGPGESFSLYTVSNPASKSLAQSQIRFQNGSDYVVFPWGSGVALNSVNPTLDTGFTGGAYTIESYHSKPSEANGVRTFSNGSLVDSDATTTGGVTVSLRIGSGTGSEFFSGAQRAWSVLLNASLSDAERSQMDAYLSDKTGVEI